MDRTPPLSGAHLLPNGVRFSLYSTHAEAVEVCLFDEVGGPETSRVTLAEDNDGTWSGFIDGVSTGQLYGFRVHGPHDPENGHRFNPAKLLIDPRALALSGEPPLDDAFYGSHPDDELRADSRDTGAIAPKSIVCDPAFDWQDDRRPNTPWKDSFIYECHVRGMSIRHPDVPEALRGTYLGLASEPIIAHLERLGVTAVELLPVQQIASEPHLLRNGLRNYFGYSPLGFFAPHAGYAIERNGAQVREFKQMVRTLHRRGIEVILDVVLNHTAEGNHHGRTLSLRGIDNATYYRLDSSDRRLYRDHTGCGNSIAANQPAATKLLVDCLRYWASEMHVDGFRFDLAVTLGRTADSFDVDAPFFRAIADDPVLAKRKLIAEPWDLGPDGYQRGEFPAGWAEWDDRFRDETRRLWAGERFGNRDLLPILRGSEAPTGDRRSSTSVHFVACHDGFTLEDVVTYESKNNWANGEGNRDGSNHDLSFNWGVEGPTDSLEIRQRRRQAKRNLLATVLLSPGVPMLLYGDELNRTQAGNNNAYCQDNELTWLDWELDREDREMLEFASKLATMRSKMAPLHSRDEDGSERVLTAEGRLLEAGKEISWSDPVGLYSDRGHGRAHLLLFNVGARERVVRLPRPAARGCWTRMLSSVEPGERSLSGATYRLCARSISVLEFTPGEIHERQ